MEFWIFCLALWVLSVLFTNKIFLFILFFLNTSESEFYFKAILWKAWTSETVCLDIWANEWIFYMLLLLKNIWKRAWI